jgi:hypothetical protein
LSSADLDRLWREVMDNNCPLDFLPAAKHDIAPWRLGNFGASEDSCRGTLATKLKMRLRSIASLNMPQLSVEVFVDEMERLGLRV